MGSRQTSVSVALVCAGGALGSGARYLAATWAAQAFGPDFPRGTLLVNVVGSYLIALVMGLSLRTGAISPRARLFLATGVMGGFTTYSSFSWETLRLLDGGVPTYALLNVALMVFGCLGAGFLGLLTAWGLARLGGANTAT